MITQQSLSTFDMYTFYKEASSEPHQRIGQYFINKYWKGTDDISRKLFQLDGEDAIMEIATILADYQLNIKGE